MIAARRLTLLLTAVMLGLGASAPGASAASLTMAAEDTTMIDPIIYLAWSGTADPQPGGGTSQLYGWVYPNATECPTDSSRRPTGDVASFHDNSVPAGPFSMPFRGYAYVKTPGRFLVCGYLSGYTGDGMGATPAVMRETAAAPVFVEVAPAPPGNLLSVSATIDSDQLVGPVFLQCFSLHEADCPTTSTATWRTDEAGRRALRTRSRLLDQGRLKTKGCGSGYECVTLGDSLRRKVDRLAERSEFTKPITVKLTATIKVTAPREHTFTIPFAVTFRGGDMVPLRRKEGRKHMCSTTTERFLCEKDGKRDEDGQPAYNRAPQKYPYHEE